MPTLPVVAIVGRPNVGKSSLFNRLIGHRRAVVEDFPGTTRDRLYGTCEWNAREFFLVDTGGIAKVDKNNPIEIGLANQIKAAIQEADILLFVADGQSPITFEDDEALRLVRRTKKPVIFTLNKIDGTTFEINKTNFYEMGLGEPITISAIQGRGTGDLLDKIVNLLPAKVEQPVVVSDKEATPPIRIAIIGRPNVGKSTLINQLLKSERVIVSSTPGTTRDTIDVDMDFQGRKLTLIDTAGIRKRGKIDVGIEHYSVLRAMQAIARCDVVFALFDPDEGITSQDLHVLGYALDEYKSIVMVANKWDLMKDKAETIGVARDRFIATYERAVRDELKFMSFAPFVTISALHDVRVGNLLEMATHLYDQRFIRLGHKQLKTILQPVITTNPAPSKRGVSLYVYDYKQIDVSPPTFEFEVNDKELFHFSYQRSLINAIRKVYPFTGSPIKVLCRNRPKKVRTS